MPLVGLIGTGVGIVVAFQRIGTEPEWRTLCMGIAVGLTVTMPWTIVVAALVFRSRR